jgi:hypothetical protein
MARSGSTLQYQIASELVERLSLGVRVPWQAKGEFASVRHQHRSESGWRVFKAHRLTSAARDEILHHGGRVLTCHRDIRDVTVSWMQKNHHEFSHVWERGLLARWTERLDEWAELPEAYVTPYNRLRDDLGGEVRRVAEVLGLDPPGTVIEAITNTLNVEEQRKRTARLVQSRQPQDQHSLLHYNHLATGADALYTSRLRPAEIRAIETQCAEWMKRHGYVPARPSLTLREWWYARRLGPSEARGEPASSIVGIDIPAFFERSQKI